MVQKNCRLCAPSPPLNLNYGGVGIGLFVDKFQVVCIVEWKVGLHIEGVVLVLFRYAMNQGDERATVNSLGEMSAEINLKNTSNADVDTIYQKMSMSFNISEN